MKVNEIISESKKGSIPTNAANSSTGEWVFRDDGTDRIYNLNRIMMAAAMHDGHSDHAVEMDEASWVEKNNVARPYTEQEHRMMKGAFKTIKSSAHHTVKDHRSKEDNTTHKQSAVPHNSGARRNKPKN